METVKYFIVGILLAAVVVNGLPGDPCAPDCTGKNGLFPNPTDCTKYYQCAQGIAVPRTCADGTYFNPNLSLCDFPEDAGCTADPNYNCGAAAGTTTGSPATTTEEVPTTTAGAEVTTTGAAETTTGAAETTTGAAETTTGAAATTTGAAETTTGAAATTTVPVPCIPPCPSLEAVYPNPRDCTSFFQCSNGVPYKFDCPRDLYFNPELKRCDFPSNVDCTAGPDAPCVAVTQPPSS